LLRIALLAGFALPALAGTDSLREALGETLAKVDYGRAHCPSMHVNDDRLAALLAQARSSEAALRWTSAYARSRHEIDAQLGNPSFMRQAKAHDASPAVAMCSYLGPSTGLTQGVIAH
jgi:hypothetical protein